MMRIRAGGEEGTGVHLKAQRDPPFRAIGKARDNGNSDNKNNNNGYSNFGTISIFIPYPSRNFA